MQRGPRLHQEPGRGWSGVGKGVWHTGKYGDRFAHRRNDRPPSEPETHPTVQYCEALLLLRVKMPGRNAPARTEMKLELDESPAGLGPSPQEDYPLSAGWVLDSPAGPHLAYCPRTAGTVAPGQCACPELPPNRY